MSYNINIIPDLNEEEAIIITRCLSSVSTVIVTNKKPDILMISFQLGILFLVQHGVPTHEFKEIIDHITVHFKVSLLLDCELFFVR